MLPCFVYVLQFSISTLYILRNPSLPYLYHTLGLFAVYFSSVRDTSFTFFPCLSFFGIISFENVNIFSHKAFHFRFKPPLNSYIYIWLYQQTSVFKYSRLGVCSNVDETLLSSTLIFVISVRFRILLEGRVLHMWYDPSLLLMDLS